MKLVLILVSASVFTLSTPFFPLFSSLCLSEIFTNSTLVNDPAMFLERLCSCFVEIYFLFFFYQNAAVLWCMLMVPKKNKKKKKKKKNTLPQHITHTVTKTHTPILGKSHSPITFDGRWRMFCKKK